MINELKDLTKIGRWVVQEMGRSERRMFLLAMLLMLLAACLTNLPAVLTGRLIDRMLATSDLALASAIPTIALILCAIVGRELLNVLRKYLVENACTLVYKYRSISTVVHLLRLDIVAEVVNQRAGSIQGRMYRSIDGYVKLLKLAFLDLLPAAFTGACALYFVAQRNPRLAALMACVVPGGVLLTLIQMQTQRGIRVELLRVKEEIDGRLVELISGLEFIRAANTGPQEVKRIGSSFEGLRLREIKHHVSMAWFDAGKYWNEGVFYILVFTVTLWLANTGHNSVGDVLSYTVLFGAVVSPLREVHRILDEAHESALRVKDLMEMMAWKEDSSFEVRPGLEVQSVRNHSGAAVEFEDVTFTYPNSDISANGLRHFTLAIKPGETIGIVGKSGTGKSTILRLLLGLIRPQRGTIRIFGDDIQSLSRETIGELFTFVPQTPFLFQGSIYENISYGCGEVSSDAVQDAAQRAQIHAEIMNFPEGYRHLVSERGNNLSGGQRQRIALARALLRKTPILILDEATSALDSVNERQVQDALNAIGSERTVIVVAHRLSTLRGADRILVLSGGRIAEDGSFETLLQNGGGFAELALMSNDGDHGRTQDDPIVARECAESFVEELVS